jgi:tetratricopeptide (TPR) repeat protein
MKKNTLIILFIFFISNNIVCSQTYTKQQIDSLLKVGEKHIYNMDAKTKPLALDIIKQSKKIQYTQGVIDGYELIIALYCFKGEFKTAQEYIALAEKEMPNEKDTPAFISIIRLKGDCLSRTGLYQRARKEFDRCLRIADKIENKDSKHSVKANIYNSIAMTISKQDKTNDSIFYYYRKCISEFQQRTGHEEGKTRSIAQANLNISSNFILIKKYDSAAYYVQRTLKMLDKNDTSILKLNAHKNLGDIYLGKREYDSAIYYYESILDKAKATRQIYTLSSTYSKLSTIYGILGNDQKSKEYNTKYIKADNELAQLEGQGLESSVKNIEKKHDEDFETSRVIFIGSILLFIGIIFYFFIKRLKNVKADKKKKEEELERLTDSNRVTLEEVLQLAKNKDASFFIKFQELYPDFIEKLVAKTEKEVTLIHSELILCAMIKLGFTTKEIAQNLNSTVGAIETRKHRLRKKLNIVSLQEDFTIWMMNL